MVAHSIVEIMFYVKVGFQRHFLIFTNDPVLRAEYPENTSTHRAGGLTKCIADVWDCCSPAWKLALLLFDFMAAGQFKFLDLDYFLR